MIGQCNWKKNDENTHVVPPLIKDSNGGRFHQLYQKGYAGQTLPGSGYLRRLVRNLGTGPGASDSQICGIGHSMADKQNQQKSDGNPPAAPMFIRDGNGDRFGQPSQEDSADQ